MCYTIVHNVTLHVTKHTHLNLILVHNGATLKLYGPKLNSVDSVSVDCQLKHSLKSVLTLSHPSEFVSLYTMMAYVGGGGGGSIAPFILNLTARC